VQRCPDIALAQSLLGWQPHVALDDGLARTIAYFDRLFAERGVQREVGGIAAPVMAG